MIWLEGTDLNRRPSGYGPDEHSRLLHPPILGEGGGHSRFHYSTLGGVCGLSCGVSARIHVDKLPDVGVPDKAR